MTKEFSSEDKDFIIIQAIENLARECNKNSHNKGFWDDTVNSNLAVKIALMHSELSEALEATRQVNPFFCMDTNCSEFRNLEIEFADCIIRILDTCHEYNLKIGEAILAKMKFNKERPYKHDKNF